MPNPEIIKLAPNATVIFGKPAHPHYGDIFNRTGVSFAYDEAIVEAHLPQYFILGAMPAPKLSLVLVTRDISQQQGVTLQVRSILAKLNLTHLISDVLIMREDDALLPSVRRANCKINFQ